MQKLDGQHVQGQMYPFTSGIRDIDHCSELLLMTQLKLQSWLSLGQKDPHPIWMHAQLEVKY